MNAIRKYLSVRRLSQLSHCINPDTEFVTLCKLGRHREALDSLLSDRTGDPSLPSSAYSPLLQFCIDSGARDDGVALHRHLLSTRHTPDLHLSTKFIIFYAKFGDLTTARTVFDDMPERSVVTWTALISGCSRNGRAEEALEVFFQMRSTGLKANQYTYGSALRACTSVGCISSGQQIHGCIAKSRFQDDLFVQSALVDMHLKCGSVDDAWHLFRKMEKRDVVAWNSIVGGCAVRGLGDGAFGVFCSMIKDGVQPDHFTYASVLRACGVVRVLVHVNQIHASIVKSGHGSHCAVSGSLVDAYAKCKSLGEAKQVYDSMVDRDLISSTALVTGCAMDINYSWKAFEIFCEINNMGMKIDNVMLSSMLNVCANVPSLDFGRQIHAQMFKNHSDIDVPLGNALIDMYAKSGELQDACHAFDEMRYKNVISWTSLITGYGKNGCGEGAVTLFSKMEENGVKPNDITFLALLFACSHSGLVSKGLECLNSMVTKYHINPRNEHYSCVVDLLARRGLLQEAYDLVCKMNIKPNASLWGAVLGACRVHGDISLGEVSAKHLLNLFPDKSVNYVVLSNVYAAAGLWEPAWKMRQMMEARSIKKDSGYSYI
ncbi:pentatricopeptide repeat-containing protein [Canna indica]|uniref:Pentatricopeptide repeat-containing protein n=1 Tax=Canna indica TaxID=4628 RepID=A0AAQ3QK36_9LILI|nr:pentatricopeptide repeat-containing protein [Canna indica]